jgi:hypothetical protein
VTTRLVDVSVIARDAKGPVADLTVTLNPVENGWLGTLDLVIAQHFADGRDVATVGDPVRVNPDKQRYETLLKEGLLLRRQIQLRPGVSKVRVVVFDRGSGRIGSLEFNAPK